MTASEPTDPSPDNTVISVSTTEVYTEPDAIAAPVAPVAAPPAAEAEVLHSTGEGNEPDVWEDRYAFGNFAGRVIFGVLLLALTGYLAYTYLQQGYPTRILTYLSGIATACFWLWLAFRIVRARMSHHYRLTTQRLFVSSGIFRRDQEMMELKNLKEVSIQHQKFLDHFFNIATVVVTSDVPGASTLFLLGIKNPQAIMDQIYHQARG